MSVTRYRTWAFGLAVLFTLGSGSLAMAADETTAVEGKVTLNGKPVAGRILFHQQNGQFIGAKIDNDGSFKVDRVLIGKHKVTVEGKGIPAQYSSDDVSPLLAEVKNGKNVFDFVLTAK